MWCCFVRKDAKSVELAFLQYIKCVPPWDAVNKASRCVCLRRETMNGGEDESKVGRSVKKTDCTVAEEWFAPISFQSNLSTLLVVQESTVVQPSSTKQS